MPKKAPVDFNKRSHDMWYRNVQRYREALHVTKGAPFELDFFRAQVARVMKTPCPYCSETLKIDNVSLDHKIPTSRADEFSATLLGEQTLTPNLKAHPQDALFNDAQPYANTAIKLAFSWGNTALCCKRCNRAKGDLTDFEFLSLRCFISTLPTKAMKYIYTKLSSVPMRFFGKAQNARANKKTSVLAQPGEDF